MCLKYPEFTDDAAFKTQIALRFNEENMFAELKQMEIMERRIEFIGSLKDGLSKSNPITMEEENYFDMDFLVDRYLKLSPDDKEANAAYKKRKESAEAGEEPEDPFGMGGMGGLGGGGALGI